MPIVDHWDLQIDAEKVLWGQGADPAVIKKRNPRLFEVAQSAVEEGYQHIHPILLYRRIPVIGFKHERVLLDEGISLNSPLIKQHMLGAEEIVVAVCTVGQQLTDYASEIFNSDPVRGLALDGLASAAAEALGEAACQYFESIADQEGTQTSIPLNPGMIGWPVQEGQQQIFSLISPQEIGISLSPGGFMVPIKSLSLLMGFGVGLTPTGRSCDFCTMRETCRYKDHYD
jgi:hypothetical protein